MGETDLLDENDNRYKIGLRAEIVVLFIYVAYIYIHIKRLEPLQKVKQIPVSIKTFTHDIVQTYLVTFRNLPKRPRLSTKIPDKKERTQCKK